MSRRRSWDSSKASKSGTFPIRRAILEHPFVAGIGQGNLDVERFKFYVAQDYVYLIDYARRAGIGGGARAQNWR